MFVNISQLPVNKKNEKEPPIKEGVDSVAEGGAAPGEGQHQLEHVVQVPGQTPETAECCNSYLLLSKKISYTPY